MTEKESEPGPRPVVYSCSGCSDAGELADRVARALSRTGAAEMSCIAGVGGRVKSLCSKARTAERILAIDGCALNCVANTLRGAGISTFQHLELQKLGFRKGNVPVNEESIARGVNAAADLITPEEAVRET